MWSLRTLTLLPGKALLEFREGVTSAVAVVSEASGRNLRVDNRFQMGGTSPSALPVQQLQTNIPLLLHARPRHVLYPGVASGVTAATALLHPDVHVTGVELVPEVLDLLVYFEPQNRGLQHSTGVDLRAADARRFIRSTRERYDVIVGDLFHPGRDGAGMLYTVEHFEAVRARLAAGGSSASGFRSIRWTLRR